MELKAVNQWLMNLSANYSVDPYIFAIIYLGAIPFFMVSLVWAIRNKKLKKPVTIPIISTAFWLCSSYLYLFIAGDNLPIWVYIVVFILLGYVSYGIYRKLRSNHSKRQ